jgi:hypothetical protein
MLESIVTNAGELLLSSMYRTRGEDGLVNKFLFGPPGAPPFARSLGTQVFFRQRQLVRAALFVRRSGPAYLKALSVSDIQSKLRKFVVENYGLVANETFLQQFDVSYNEHLSDPTRTQFVQALAASDIFQPHDDLSLYPLVPLKVAEDFWSPSFFLIRPSSLANESTISQIGSSVRPEEFPPVADWDGKKERPGSWLGIRSPAIQASNKMKAAILGALALTPHPRYRHQFSMRAMFGGVFTLKADGGSVMSYGEHHTPGMSEDIVVRKSDHEWLAALSPKLLDVNGSVRRQVRALEYFYRAWPLDAPDRFPWLFMALDALFGDSSQATQAVIDAMGKHGEANFEYERLKLLLRLRASVIHGGAPDVYDSDKYHRYYEQYGDDPIFDLELITARCLRSEIFGGLLIEHPDPNADLIRAYREGRTGRGL